MQSSRAVYPLGVVLKLDTDLPNGPYVAQRGMNDADLHIADGNTVKDFKTVLEIHLLKIIQEQSKEAPMRIQAKVNF